MIPKYPMIDLHCHSNYSDGLLSPNELLAKAVQANIKLLALTDHDTLEGVKVLLQECKQYPITIINGIELSVRWKKHVIHLLGLNINLEDNDFNDLLIEQNNRRIERAQQIAEKLHVLGIKDAYEKACRIAGHSRIGRPHLAQVIVNEGFATDIQAAFKKYLKKGCPAYIDTFWVSLEEGVIAIVKAKGQAVIAHPLKYKLTRSKLIRLIEDFKQAGGAGIEVVSGDTANQQIQEMAELSMQFDLLASTGSDFHGDKMSSISLGRQPQLPLNCKPIWQNWNF